MGSRKTAKKCSPPSYTARDGLLDADPRRHESRISDFGFRVFAMGAMESAIRSHGRGAIVLGTFAAFEASAVPSSFEFRISSFRRRLSGGDGAPPLLEILRTDGKLSHRRASLVVVLIAQVHAHFPQRLHRRIRPIIR